MISLSFAAKPNGLAIAALFLSLAVACAEDLPPTPKNYFNDYAAVTSKANRHELEERLAKFNKDTSNQVVVAIFPKMDSTLPLEQYTLQVANSWAIGQAGKNNGVALFVFIRDHKMRIEVGKGLTGILTDALAKQILDHDLTPRFKKGDFDGGFIAGVDSILKILGGKESGEQREQK